MPATGTPAASPAARSAAERSAAAERSVTGRHLHRPLLTPWTRLAWAGCPPTLPERCFVSFHYWWQAHVLDCLLDAQLRDPTPTRRRLITHWPAAMAVRNGIGWLNQYYDDNAWLGLALDRMAREQAIVVPARWHVRDLRGGRHREPGGARGVGGAGGAGGPAGARALALDRVLTRLERGWAEEPLGGGIPWRLGDVFRNAPANGPMTILLARRGRLTPARRALAWMRERYLDAETGLVVDGIRPDPTGTTPWWVDRTFYTYNQGVMLGAEVAVLRAGLDRASGEEAGSDGVDLADTAAGVDPADTAARVRRLIEAVDRGMAEGHVVVGYEGRSEQGGDEGLFRGILARYLAVVAADLPGDTPDARAARRLAAALVRSTADALWDHRNEADDQVWFGPDPRVDARIPRRSDPTPLPERDLSVQVGAWMVLEAAVRCAAAASAV